MPFIKILTDSHQHLDQPVPKGTVLEVEQATADHFAAIGAAEITDPKKKEG